MKKKFFRRLVLLILLLLLGWLGCWCCGGVSHREIHETVKTESKHLHIHLDERANRVEEKLDRMEAKLDQLLKLASTPSVSDNVQVN